MSASDLAEHRAEQFSTICHELYPKNTTKSVMADLGIRSLDTAKKLVSGAVPPSARVLHMANLKWGSFVAARVLTPEPEWSRADRVAAHIQRLERQLEEIKELAAWSSGA